MRCPRSGGLRVALCLTVAECYTLPAATSLLFIEPQRTFGRAVAVISRLGPRHRPQEKRLRPQNRNGLARQRRLVA